VVAEGCYRDATKESVGMWTVILWWSLAVARMGCLSKGPRPGTGGSDGDVRGSGEES
jgi:hypothetical protein